MPRGMKKQARNEKAHLNINDNLSAIRATPHNSARANPEENWILTMAVFRRNTLCISRKSDEVRVQFFQEAPMANCAVLP